MFIVDMKVCGELLTNRKFPKLHRIKFQIQSILRGNGFTNSFAKNIIWTLTEPVSEGLHVPGGPNAQHVWDSVAEGGRGHSGDSELHSWRHHYRDELLVLSTSFLQQDAELPERAIIIYEENQSYLLRSRFLLLS